MAAAALTPRVRIMAICDGVRASKTEMDVIRLSSVSLVKSGPIC